MNKLLNFNKKLNTHYYRIRAKILPFTINIHFRRIHMKRKMNFFKKEKILKKKKKT